MRDEERSRDAHFDDWFDEPETGDVWSARVDRLVRERRAQHAGEPVVDDWLGESTARGRDSSAATRVPSRRMLLVGALLVLLLLGVLAAAGVFSGSTPKTAATSSTAPTSSAPSTTTATRTQPRVPAVPTGSLKPGDRGPAVAQLQRALRRAGYAPGTIDGVYGTATKQTVAHFQQANGLTADGVAGPQTLAALKHALQSE